MGMTLITASTARRRPTAHAYVVPVVREVPATTTAAGGSTLW
jgi:hypothetical protein